MNVHGLIVAIAYFLGSIPFGLMIVKASGGDDIRQKGSGNIGARQCGSERRGISAGLLTLFLDASKGLFGRLDREPMGGWQR